MMWFSVFLFIIVEDIVMVVLTGVHCLQDSCQAAVQSLEMLLRQERSHRHQRVLGQGLTHDVTQTELQEGQETQALQRGDTDQDGEVR